MSDNTSESLEQSADSVLDDQPTDASDCETSDDVEVLEIEQSDETLIDLSELNSSVLDALKSIQDQISELSNGLGTDESKNDELKLGELLQKVSERQTKIAEFLRASEDKTKKLRDDVREIKSAIHDNFEQLTETLSNRVGTTDEEDVPATNNEWANAIFGPQLANENELTNQLESLVAGILAGDETHKLLASQILLIQTVAPERFATVARELGEAYYRWQPSEQGTIHAFETKLVQFVNSIAEMKGTKNTIECVRIGQRFDQTRHSAIGSPGPQIVEVHGWSVLRDNGKPVSKASVVAR